MCFVVGYWKQTRNGPFEMLSNFLPGKTVISPLAVDRQAGLLTTATIGRGFPSPIYFANAGEHRPLTITTGISLPTLSKYGQDVGSYVYLANLERDELDANPPEREGHTLRAFQLFSKGDYRNQTFAIGGNLSSPGYKIASEKAIFAVYIPLTGLNWYQIAGDSKCLFNSFFESVPSHDARFVSQNSLLILHDGDQVDLYLKGLNTYGSSFRYNTSNIYPSFQRWKLWVIDGKLTFAPHRYWYEHKQEQKEAEHFQQIAESERREIQ